MPRIPPYSCLHLSFFLPIEVLRKLGRKNGTELVTTAIVNVCNLTNIPQKRPPSSRSLLGQSEIRIIRQLEKAFHLTSIKAGFIPLHFSRPCRPYICLSKGVWLDLTDGGARYTPFSTFENGCRQADSIAPRCQIHSWEVYDDCPDRRSLARYLRTQSNRARNLEYSGRNEIISHRFSSERE